MLENALIAWEKHGSRTLRIQHPPYEASNISARPEDVKFEAVTGDERDVV